MHIKFSYDEIAGFDIPEKNLMGIYQPRSSNIPQDVGELVKRAMENPVYSPRLKKMASPDDKVLILVDDYTRATPASQIIPYVLEELLEAGVKEENISFLIALGTHRPMRYEEKVDKLGRDILKRYTVMDHCWDDNKEMRYLGTTSRGTEIWVNRHVLESTLVIGIGQIFPHRITGFSGGTKIIQPGVCGKVTTGQTHWLGANYNGEEIMGVIDNPVREELNEIGLRVGLRFIVNVIIDAEEKVVGVVAGHPVEAHREGASLSDSYLSIPLPSRPDVILIESYPADVDLWQASKAIYAAGTSIKKGGVIILVSPCYEGVSPTHGGTLLKFGCGSLDDIEKLVKEGVIEDLTAAAWLVYVGEIVTGKADLVLVTPGIPEDEAIGLGLKWAPGIQEAIEYCDGKLGRNYQVAVVRKGGISLPRAPR